MQSDIPLKPLTSESPKRVRVVVWDIESTQTGDQLIPFLVGVRWGEGSADWAQFQGLDCIEQFLVWTFENTSEETIFFSHNGGGFDHLFLLHEAIDKQAGRYTVKPILSGSAAIIVRIIEKASERQTMFCDSLRLLNMSLKKIGEKLGGARKQELDIKTPITDPRWLEYNNQDTLVLYQALIKLQTALLDLGGVMKMTAASSSLDLWRRKYLPKPIHPITEHHTFYRACYFGGRVELFDMRRRTDVRLFDINSLYPYACTYPLPVQLEDDNDVCFSLEACAPDGPECWFVECLVDVPQMVAAPLPLRRDNKLIFPVGRFWGTWSSADLWNLHRAGGRIVTVKRAHRYKTYPIAREMMQNLYAARLDVERPEMGLAGKLLMNSWYGKLAQREDKDDIIFYPGIGDLDTRNRWWVSDDPQREQWSCKYIKRDVHCIPQIAAHVTAIARSIHYPYLLNSVDPIYCDTDCIVQTGDMATGTDLGQMKLEASYKWFEAVLPKLYHGETVDGQLIDKAKGFGGWNKEKFEGGTVSHLASGGVVTVRGPAKLRTLLKGGSLQPREIATPKQVRATYTKRVVHDDGTTSPIKLWES